MTCSKNGAQRGVDYYDVGARTLINGTRFTPPHNETPTYDCSVRPSIGRQMFDPGYSLLAVTSPTPAGDATHVGVLTEDGPTHRGVFHDLSTDSDSYAGSTQETSPIFNEQTGRLWFNTPHGTFSIDPKLGSSSRRQESSESHQNAFFFATNGGYLREATGLWEPVSPSGRWKANFFSGLRAGAPDIPDDSLPYVKVPRDVRLCALDVFVDDRRVLCVQRYNPGAGGQIYLMTFNASHDRLLSQKPLLPPSDRTPETGLVVSPDQASFAFVAGERSSRTLYVAPMDGARDPVKIASLDYAYLDAEPVDWVK